MVYTARDRSRETRIVLFAPQATPAIEARARSRGADAVLRAPADVARLVCTLLGRALARDSSLRPANSTDVLEA
jgi:hypothetical protein